MYLLTWSYPLLLLSCHIHSDTSHQVIAIYESFSLLVIASDFRIFGLAADLVVLGILFIFVYR